MASFICHSTSSLNCRISSARSCGRAGREPVQRHGQPELDIAARQADAALEVMQAGAVDPRVVLRPIGQPLLVDFRREQFRQRRTRRLLPGRAPRKIHIRIHGEADPRQHITRLSTLRARKPGGLREPQPGLDAARIIPITVVIQNPLHPLAAHRAVRAVGEDRGILDRDVDLVVEAVRDPAPDLLRRAPRRSSASR